MLPKLIKGQQGPLWITLSWLGGSGWTWTEVSDGLAALGVRSAAIDLPGFGAAADSSDFSIDAMVEEVIATVQAVRQGEARVPWLLAGHSMGGKVAALVARAALDGREGLDNLAGMVLVSPSPPGPEPMEESKRADLLASLGKRTSPAQDRAHAEKFVDDNTGKQALDPAVRIRSVEDVLRSSGGAFEAWLTAGSKEDRAAQVGSLPLPVLVLAGTEDAALGPDAQRTHTLPFFPQAELAILEGGGHLAPLERPAEVVERIAMFMEKLNLPLQRSQGELGSAFQALIASSRTAPQTRAVLQARLHPAQSPEVLSAEQRITLRALCARVVPETAFDLAGRIEGWLAQNKHDGWRDDRLPADTTAWRKGLRTLDAAATQEHGVPFAALPSESQDALLHKAQTGSLQPRLNDPTTCLDGEQMATWFEEVRGELAKQYIADPRTMERIGFTGFADEQGFAMIQLGEREEFEN